MKQEWVSRSDKIIKSCEEIGKEHGEYRLAAQCGALHFHIADLCREIDDLKHVNEAPKPHGLLVTTYCDFVVHFEYDQAEDATWEEPGTPEDITVHGVYAGRSDIEEFLDDKIIDIIKERCLLSVKTEKFNNEFDKAAHD